LRAFRSTAWIVASTTPIVLAGARGIQPEPIADFLDAVVLGDGEEIALRSLG
jgi:hypothetical protein